MKLSEVEPQGHCRIVDAAAGHAEIQSRLYTLGLYPGVQVRVLRLAPLGDPMQIKVGNALLSIRLQEASLIQVDRL
jgi:Fe2+ transport system protein FeoA